MMKKCLLVTILFLGILPVASARNPKYEKMLKHLVRHQKEYVGMEAGSFYKKIQEEGYPIRWVNLHDKYRNKQNEVSGISLYSETQLQMVREDDFYTVRVKYEENTMPREGFFLDIPRDPFPIEMPDNNPFVKGVLEKTKSFKVRSIECTFRFSEPLEGMKNPKNKKEKKKAKESNDGPEVFRIHEPGA